jgi:hypothetical protein|tara:strand:+ start:12595 stop:13155 length:561 start_codon:yes stop_codon:yes gene_type:complete
MFKRRRSVLGVAEKAYEVTGEFLDEFGIFDGEGRPRRIPEAIPVDGPVAPTSGWRDRFWPFRKPDPTWRDYEKAAVAFLVGLGYSGVGAAAAGADGGVDVWVTGILVGQVKAQQTKVGSPPLQQLYGIACKENVQGLFFSKSGYSKPAIQWANSVEMPLFNVSYRGDHFAVEPVNRSAERFGAVGA